MIAADNLILSVSRVQTEMTHAAPIWQEDRDSRKWKEQQDNGSQSDNWQVDCFCSEFSSNPCLAQQTNTLPLYQRTYHLVVHLQLRINLITFVYK